MAKEPKTVIKTVYRLYPKGMITFGVNILSVMISWYFNKSVLWAIFHFIFGWIYLPYSLLIGRFVDGGFMEIINSYF